jgi:hypothetical protein
VQDFQFFFLAFSYFVEFVISFPKKSKGSEAVEWLKKEERVSEEEAIKIGQAWLELEIIHHADMAKKPFYNAPNMYYRFQVKKKKNNTKPLFSLSRKANKISSPSFVALFVSFSFFFRISFFDFSVFLLQKRRTRPSKC